MPLKLNVGASKKITDQNFGSRGASINLEIELDSGLMMDPAKLQGRIRQLFNLVRVSLMEELNGANSDKNHALPQSSSAPVQNGQPVNGRKQTGAARPATASQVRAIHAIARAQQIDLQACLHERFQVRRLNDLTLKEASQFIDELKSSEVQADG